MRQGSPRPCRKKKKSGKELLGLHRLAAARPRARPALLPAGSPMAPANPGGRPRSPAVSSRGTPARDRLLSPPRCPAPGAGGAWRPVPSLPHPPPLRSGQSTLTEPEVPPPPNVEPSSDSELLSQNTHPSPPDVDRAGDPPHLTSIRLCDTQTDDTQTDRSVCVTHRQ